MLREGEQVRPIANDRIKAMTDGKPAIFIVEWDGHLISRPEDWIEVPEVAMPAIEYIIAEVRKGEKP